MLTRRFLLPLFALLLLAPHGWAQDGGAQNAGSQADHATRATGFIRDAGVELVRVVNSPAPDAQKKQELQTIVNRIVNVEEIGQFCLGRAWRVATPKQQQDYLGLFHAVLNNNITSKVGEYRGVAFVLTRTVPRNDDVAVGTLITRPNNAPANVQWIVSFASGEPKIVDVVAEGTSLRLTQRSDYASYLAHNGNNVQALIDAMRQQVGG